MAKRRRPKKKSTRARLGEPIFFGLACLFAIIAFYLKDFYGIQFRWIGSYVWLAAYFFGFTGYLFYLVQFILPLDWKSSWYEGLILAIPYNFPILDRLARTFLRPRAPAATQQARSKLVQGFLVNRAGVLPSQQALAVITGSQYSQAAGPGYVRLRSSESVAQVIDLRRHMGRERVKAMTSDGIPLETVLTVLFQVRQEDPPIDPAMAYPYDRSAIFRVNYLESFSSEEGDSSWNSRVVRRASSLLIEELSRYTLDELFQHSENAIPPLTKAISRLHKQLVEFFQTYGVTIIQISLGKIVLPEEVVDQRIGDWQARWSKRIGLEENDIKTIISLPTSLDRLKTRDTFIQEILNGIEAARLRGDNELADTVIEQIYGSLMTAATDESVRALLSKDDIAGLKRLHQYVYDKGG